MRHPCVGRVSVILRCHAGESRECVWYRGLAPWPVADLKPEVAKEFGPSDLALIQKLSGSEMLKVFVVGDDLNRLRGEVCIVDAQMGIEPINFICNKLARNETL